jgi:hypothetical protein
MRRRRLAWLLALPLVLAMALAMPLPMALATALALPAGAQPAGADYPAPGMGHKGEGPATCIVGPDCANYDDPYHHGCGSRGGPGCRKANGHCAAWRDGFAPDCRAKPRP